MCNQSLIVVRNFSNKSGGTVSLAFHLDNRGYFFRQHKHRKTKAKQLLAQGILGAHFLDHRLAAPSRLTIGGRHHHKPRALIAVPGDEDYPDDIVKAVLAESDDEEDHLAWVQVLLKAIKWVGLSLLFFGILTSAILLAYRRYLTSSSKNAALPSQNGDE